MHSIIESTNCGGPSAWSLGVIGKVHTFHHRTEAQTACHGVGQKLRLLVDETVRHIFVFCGFTFSGKVKCHFKC